MSEALGGGRACGATRYENDNEAALRIVDWLYLAAAPTFAIMALITSILGSGQPDVLCASGQGVSSLYGMVLMYLLMSVFHSPPWLKLISRRRSDAIAGEQEERSECVS